MPEANSGSGTPSGSEGTGYSADYVKSLRDENASWRTKLRETETRLSELESKITSEQKNNTIATELTKRGLTGINPRWVEIEEGSTPDKAVDKFLKDYSHILRNGSEDDFKPKGSNFRPMHPVSDNSNIENTAKSELGAIKKDPIARAKLRDHYRSLLATNSKSTFNI